MMQPSELTLDVEKAKDNLVEASLNFAAAVSSNRIDIGGVEEAFWDAVENYQDIRGE